MFPTLVSLCMVQKSSYLQRKFGYLLDRLHCLKRFVWKAFKKNHRSLLQRLSSLLLLLEWLHFFSKRSSSHLPAALLWWLQCHTWKRLQAVAACCVMPRWQKRIGWGSRVVVSYFYEYLTEDGLLNIEDTVDPMYVKCYIEKGFVLPNMPITFCFLTNLL